MTTTTTDSKRAFDFSRDTAWKCDPHTDLCIVGGKGILEGDEEGELDTVAPEGHHPLFSPVQRARLQRPLLEERINNVDTFGVIVPIVIVKMGELACVVAGRTRVRWARAVNRRRQRAGMPLIKVSCVVRRANAIGLSGAMLAENAVRQDDTPIERITNLKHFMSTGVDIEDAAVTMGVPLNVAQTWLKFDDNAIDRVKLAVESGTMALAAGIEIANLKSADAQNAALDKLEASIAEGGGKASARAARSAAKQVKRGGSDEDEGVARNELKRMLALVREMPHPNASAATMSWWEGVEDVLVLVLGADGEKDARLTKTLADVRDAMKKDAKAKATKTTSKKSKK
jgi:ParB family chromosome partitioning protein